MNTVVAGDYAKKGVGFYKYPYIGIGFGPSAKNRVNINSETVESYEIQNQGQKKSAGRAVAGAIIAGPLGMAVGALSGKTKGILIAVQFKDGKKSLIECDQKICDAIVKACF